MGALVFFISSQTMNIRSIIIQRKIEFNVLFIKGLIEKHAFFVDRFWPVIDDALRTAALKRVEVRLLISHWNHTRSEIKYFLKSLVDLTGIKKNVVIKAVSIQFY